MHKQREIRYIYFVKKFPNSAYLKPQPQLKQLSMSRRVFQLGKHPLTIFCFWQAGSDLVKLSTVYIKLALVIQ